MARPNWEYIRVDVLLPDNPKLDSLTAAAKWALVELWCYCGQHLTDGFVRDAKWKQFGTPGIRQQIVSADLAGRVPGGYQMHDYLEHQRSRAEVLALKEKRAEAGRRSAESRAKAKANASTLAEQDAQQTGSKPAAEAEAEAEAEVLVADVGDQSSGSNPRIAEEIDLIITEIQQVTGRRIDAEWAAKTRDLLLGGRAVGDRSAYLKQAIRAERDPQTRFLPTSLPPPYQTPNGRPARGETVRAAAAQVRQAIAKEAP